MQGWLAAPESRGMPSSLFTFLTLQVVRWGASEETPGAKGVQPGAIYLAEITGSGFAAKGAESSEQQTRLPRVEAAVRAE